jgi:nucleotidyltransferase-like protein
MRPAIPATLADSLKEYRRLLEAEFGTRLRSIRLFGSYARGDADEDSDADISVVVDGMTDTERACIIDLAFVAWRSAGGRGPMISPLPWSAAALEARRAEERRIVMDIDREGIPL